MGCKTSLQDAEERKERREKDLCSYEVSPKPAAPGDSEKVEKPKGPGFLGSYGVDCKEVTWPPPACCCGSLALWLLQLLRGGNVAG